MADEELAKSERAALSAHMEHCSQCNAMYAVFSNLSEIIGQVTDLCFRIARDVGDALGRQLHRCAQKLLGGAGARRVHEQHERAALLVGARTPCRRGLRRRCDLRGKGHAA